MKISFKRCSCFTPLTATLILLSACENATPVPNRPLTPADPRYQAMQKEMEYRSAADVSLEVDFPDKIDFTISGSAAIDSLSLALNSPISLKKNLAVVTIAKRVQMQSDESLKMLVDRIEVQLRQAGFKKVVFFFASGDGTFIYRE